jgi:glycerol-3-phosphate acyltransferase PlsX
MLPAPGNVFVLMDAGANLEPHPSNLVQYAIMGSLYSKQILGYERPRVAVLSIGTEDIKGNELTLEAFKLCQRLDLNFIGNIEGQDIPRGVTDVIVTDGFTGNIVLKTIEGLGDTFVGLVRQTGHVLSAAYHLQGRTLLSDIGLGSWVQRVDYREYGGACLLGVNGVVIVSHGRSQAKAIKNAIGLAKRTAEQDICRIIKEESHDQTNNS